MSLQTKLDAAWAAFATSESEEVCETMRRADLELAASGVIDRAIKAGERAPDFDLPNVDGRRVRLSQLLVHGPVVVSFYRGGWCPFCSLELEALQTASSRIQAAGATLVAISPQTLDESASMAETNDLDFLILSDHGGLAALDYGIAFDLAPALRPIYARLGFALPERNGVESWRLPMPATFIVGGDGRVVFAHVDSDHRNRLDPDVIVAALGRL